MKVQGIAHELGHGTHKGPMGSEVVDMSDVVAVEQGKKAKAKKSKITA
jgi:hypothetical protein